MQIVETILIVIALLSLFAFGPGSYLWPEWFYWASSPSYKYGWLTLVFVSMAWVAARRLARTRAAVEEAKRKRDEAERSGRPPWLQD